MGTIHGCLHNIQAMEIWAEVAPFSAAISASSFKSAAFWSTALSVNRYSMMARHYEPLFPILEELDVGLVAFSPMANGFLTGQYDKGQRFDAATDYRAAMPQFTDKAVDQNGE